MYPQAYYVYKGIYMFIKVYLCTHRSIYVYKDVSMYIKVYLCI